MRLDRLRWPEVEARAARSVLAVPVGSTEQHGPHLPLATDTEIAEAMCERLARVRDDVLICPPIPYSSAGEHAAFPGTLSIGSAATESVLVELGRSADAFAAVLFVSTHGGNHDAVGSAVRLLGSESRAVRAWSPARPDGGDAHAGFTETSVLLALRPESVDMEMASAGCTEPIGRLMPALRAGGVRSVSPNGVLGDPLGASAEAGERILGEWTESLLACVRGWP